MNRRVREDFVGGGDAHGSKSASAATASALVRDRERRIECGEARWMVDRMPNNALDPTAVSVSDFLSSGFTGFLSFLDRAVPSVGQLGR